VPVHYLFRGVRHDRLLAYYRLADVCLVTPLRDGMNLVAKEFVIAQDASDQTGVLVLSEFTGAAEELHEALPCNPFDVDGLASTIELALELDEQDRRQRLARMATTVHDHDVFAWAQQETSALEQARPQRSPRAARAKTPPPPTRPQPPAARSARGG
jgi:trehalose 6-phosphate synthase